MCGRNKAGLALDRADRRTGLDHSEGEFTITRIGLLELLAGLEGFQVMLQSHVDLAQVDVLLSQVIEVVAQPEPVLGHVLRCRNGSLLFGHGLLKRGNCLQVIALFVEEISQYVPASPQAATVSARSGCDWTSFPKTSIACRAEAMALSSWCASVSAIGDLHATRAEILVKRGDGRMRCTSAER